MSADPAARASGEAQARTLVRVYTCAWPDMDSVLSPCDRDLYQWIASLTANTRPAYLTSEMQRIANSAWSEQYQQWARCEAGRYASGPESESDLRLAITSRLAGGGRVRNDSVASRIAGRLSVSFAPGSGPPAPLPCTPGSDPATWPRLPYYFLHNVDGLGINYYPQNTVAEFTSGYVDSYRMGIGPWAGARVAVLFSLNGWSMASLQGVFHREVRVRSDKVFDHYAHFNTIGNPAPSANLLVRSDPFDVGAVQIQTSILYNPNAPEGERGQGWRVFIEYTRLESSQSWVVERWIEGADGWTALTSGGYSANQTFSDYFPAALAASAEADGTWLHRVCVYEFKRQPTPVNVFYGGVRVETGYASIIPLVSQPYVPGVSTGIASCEESVAVRTVGATKASFRVVGIDPVPGFGVLFKIKVVNELHFAACIVTPFLSGISDRTSWQDNVTHFSMPAVWVVRNLAAYSESVTISIMVPVQITEVGDWPLRDLHWRLYVAQEAYAAPLDQYADGFYSGWPNGQYPDIAAWPPPGYKILTGPDEYAFLLAGYLENADKVWHSSWDSTVDTNRLLATIPAHKAPGAEVTVVSDPRFPEGSPSYFEQVPFRAFVEWSVESRIQTNPEVWALRTGSESIGLDLATAIERYGRYLTLPVPAGRPMWSPYYQKWVTVFESWPGGDVEELETYLVDTYLRPRYLPANGWRNFQYTSIKKPYLTAGFMWWFETQTIVDQPGYIQVLTLIKASDSAGSVDVVLIGN